jgi:Na+-translocating ferredoxin:NAD+ oxidoreductase RnfD subunit
MSTFLQFANKFSAKTYMSIMLLMLAGFGTQQQGFNNVYQQLLLAVTTAIVLDIFINYIRKKQFILPSSAFITGMIIALVLIPGTHWYVSVIAASIAILQKHLLRYPGAKPIFNPAAAGLLAVIFLFHAGINWWGQNNLWVIIIVGLFVSYQAKKIKIPVVFIASVALIFTLGYYLIDKVWLNPFLYVNFFFVFVMLIEPKTSPYLQKDQYVYAVAVAIFSYIFFLLVPQYDYSVFALIAINLFMCLKSAITRTNSTTIEITKTP